MSGIERTTYGRTPEEEKIRNFLSAISAGISIKTACDFCSLSDATIKHWLRLAARGDKRYKEFALELSKAEAAATIAMEQVVTKAALGGSWKAAVKWLEVKRPQEWGVQAQVHRIEIAPSSVTSEDFASITDAELESIAGQIEEAELL